MSTSPSRSSDSGPGESVFASFTTEQRAVVANMIDAYVDLREAVAKHVARMEKAGLGAKARTLRRAAERNGSLATPRAFTIKDKP